MEKSVYLGVKKLVYTPSGGGEISLHPILGWINLHPLQGGEIGLPPSEPEKSIYPGVDNLVYTSLRAGEFSLPSFEVDNLIYPTPCLRVDEFGLLPSTSR